MIAKSIARIHWQNLVNFGVLPLTFVNQSDYDTISPGDVLRVEGIHAAIRSGPEILVRNMTKTLAIQTRHGLSERQANVFLTGGLINWLNTRLGAERSSLRAPAA